MKTINKEATEAFAKRLESALEVKNGGNQSELARAINCTSQAVSKWFSGSQFPREHLLRKAAEYLNVTPEWLKYGTPVTPPPPPEPKWILMYVQPDEAELLTLFRESTPTGKRQVSISAVRSEKEPPKSLPVKPSTTVH